MEANSPVSQRTLSVHREHEFLLALERAGLDGKSAQKVIDSKDNVLAQEVVRLVRYGRTLSWMEAKEMTGDQFFFGPDDWAQGEGLRGEIPPLSLGRERNEGDG